MKQQTYTAISGHDEYNIEITEELPEIIIAERRWGDNNYEIYTLNNSGNNTKEHFLSIQYNYANQGHRGCVNIPMSAFYELPVIIAALNNFCENILFSEIELVKKQTVTTLFKE